MNMARAASTGTPEQSHKADRAAIASEDLDTSSRDEFFQYYAEASLSESTYSRYLSIRRAILRVLGPVRSQQVLQVADIGCGAGSQSILWAELGHRVHGLDINDRLVELARERAAAKSLPISFSLGTATALPWPDASMDVCIMPELLEHIADWHTCLTEAIRVLKSDGVFYLTTTNKLCPVQQEFNLPLYSWYPGFLKRRYEALAKTTQPELANYATYPAVNWFSFYGLRAVLRRDGLACLDRFDTVDTGTSRLKALLVGLLRAVPQLKFLGQVATPYTQIIAIKRAPAKRRR